MNYIVNGSDAALGTFPYQASVYKGMPFICGGSIISEKHVLTAAHCVSCGRSFEVGVGSVHLAQQQKHPVEKKIVHPKYDPELFLCDIGILVLKSPLVFSNSIKAIALPKDNDKVRDSTMMVASGWGRTRSVTSLKFVYVPIVDHKKCVDNYKDADMLVTEQDICAGYLGTGGKDTCQGDSGGPLVASDKLYGVTSRGIGCASPTYPGVYASVTYFRKWIKEQTGIWRYFWRIMYISISN